MVKKWKTKDQARMAATAAAKEREDAEAKAAEEAAAAKVAEEEAARKAAEEVITVTPAVAEENNGQ